LWCAFGESQDHQQENHFEESTWKQEDFTIAVIKDTPNYW
jgi:hypothetical protein